MPYCPSCGAELGEHIEYCPHCGARVTVGEKKKATDYISSQPQLEYQETLPQLERRNYLFWFLLTIFTGIFGIIYLYYVFEDLNKIAKYPKPKGVPSPEVDTNNLMIWLVVGIVLSSFIPFMIWIVQYYIYKQKYEKLYDYIINHPQKQKTLPPSDRKYIGLMIGRDILLLFMTIFAILASVLPFVVGTSIVFAIVFGILSAFCLFGALGIGIYQIILDFRWQEALNERILIIDPNAPMKDLF